VSTTETCGSKRVSGFMLAAVLVLAAGFMAAAAASAGPERAGSHLTDAAAAIKEAIHYEAEASQAASKGDWTAVHQDLNNKGIGARESLKMADGDLGAAVSTGEIDRATESSVESHLNDAADLDRRGAQSASNKDANTVKHWIAKATAQKEKALAILAAVKPTTTNALTSPAGSGPIRITNIRCYPNGTGTNPERDADFTVAGAAWHLQQVYPASYVTGGSPTSPMVFIEDKPAPYNEPDIHIYADFNVTVSGTIGAISSGQQVNVTGSLVDSKGNAVTPSKLTLSFKCP
jgi:hypothetical protein